MPVKPRRELTEKTKNDDKKVREVLFNYFSRIGRYYPRTGTGKDELPHDSPAWKANFNVKWGRNAYRHKAWTMVRHELLAVFPDELFKRLDIYFGLAGPAKSYVDGFTHEELYSFVDQILSSSTATPEMREAVKGALQYR